MTDLWQAVANSDAAEPFTINRSVGRFVAGGWAEEKTTLKVWGIVSNLSPEDLGQIPEGDVVNGMRGFNSRQKLYRTHGDDGEGSGVSDVITYKGDDYRIAWVLDYSNRGYWKAAAVRMRIE